MNIIIFRPSPRGQSIAHTVALYLLKRDNKPASLSTLATELGIPYPSLKGVLLKYQSNGKAFERVGRANYRLTEAQADFMRKFKSSVDVTKKGK